MKANFVICLVTGMVPCKVVFETNSFSKVCNEYEKYINITISK